MAEAVPLRDNYSAAELCELAPSDARSQTSASLTGAGLIVIVRVMGQRAAFVSTVIMA